LLTEKQRLTVVTNDLQIATLLVRTRHPSGLHGGIARPHVFTLLELMWLSSSKTQGG
jgi:DeoR/GlpR family transcriptional regulator of sugar metabolism